MHRQCNRLPIITIPMCRHRAPAALTRNLKQEMYCTTFLPEKHISHKQGINWTRPISSPKVPDPCRATPIIKWAVTIGSRPSRTLGPGPTTIFRREDGFAVAVPIIAPPRRRCKSRLRLCGVLGVWASWRAATGLFEPCLYETDLLLPLLREARRLMPERWNKSHTE